MEVLSEVTGSELICKRDGRQLQLVKETEKLSDGEYRVTYSFKCPVCGYSVNAEQAVITMNDNDSYIVVKRKVFKKSLHQI